MKQIILIIAAMLFSTLFYGQYIGLNLLIFSIITLGLLIGFNRKRFSKSPIWLYSLAYMLTAILVFIYNSDLSIIANCAALFTLVGAVSEAKISIYVKWLNGIYTTIAGTFHKNFDNASVPNKTDWKKDIDFLHWAKIIGIPLLLTILFLLLYKNGNPVFNTLVSKINFDFINFQWVLFSVLGYFLFSNISQPIAVEPATSTDLTTPNELKVSEPLAVEKLKKEKQLGTILLGLLNILIVLFIITDVSYLTSTEMSSASALSSQVHNGINTLIASILIAIVIILYFFRGNLNFYTENAVLKNLSYVWIFLNILLIVLIAIKNQNYITSFGLTYKRIGVHVYILMTLIGLVTTFIKVLSVKNLTFLFRRNTQLAFLILILCSCINWDKIITNYNLNYAESYDMEYLIGLSYRNAIPLYELQNTIDLKVSVKQRITAKYEFYQDRLETNNWQEYTYDNFRFNTQTP